MLGDSPLGRPSDIITVSDRNSDSGEGHLQQAEQGADQGSWGKTGR